MLFDEKDFGMCVSITLKRIKKYQMSLKEKVFYFTNDKIKGTQDLPLRKEVFYLVYSKGSKWLEQLNAFRG